MKLVIFSIKLLYQGLKDEIGHFWHYILVPRPVRFTEIDDSRIGVFLTPDYLNTEIGISVLSNIANVPSRVI